MTNTEPIRTLQQLSQPLTARVQIENVTLLSSKISRNPDLDDAPEKIGINSGFQISGACNDDHSKARIRVRFHLTGLMDDPEKTADVFEIEAEFALVYAISSFDGLDEANLDAFGRLNGVFNAWPYWREHVQSSLAKLQLPPIIVPVLTAGRLEKIYATQKDGEKSKQGD